MAQTERDALVARITQYPRDRYPVQHATTQFHLGSLLLRREELRSAVAALGTAQEIFQQAGMALEEAKATVMLGIAQRTAGRLIEAKAAFARSCTVFSGLDQPAEHAAASYNLGLVLSDTGEHDAAHTAWGNARELFRSAGYPGQAAAAARDHGASLLSTGAVDAATELLAQAVELAELAGDEPGTGAAANVLGLAHLAAGRPEAAVAMFRQALGRVPRAVRPAEFAMVKANLALAHEQAGDQARARLAARQALAVSSAAAAVRSQAHAILARWPGQESSDLMEVLDQEDRERWVGLLREEVVRATEMSEAGRRAVIRGFFDGVLGRPGAAYDLVENFLHVLLELPPTTYELVIAAMIAACAGRPEPDEARLRAVAASAMARFAIPQWQRLAASLNAAAVAAGQPGGWR